MIRAATFSKYSLAMVESAESITDITGGSDPLYSFTHEGTSVSFYITKGLMPLFVPDGNAKGFHLRELPAFDKTTADILRQHGLTDDAIGRVSERLTDGTFMVVTDK